MPQASRKTTCIINPKHGKAIARGLCASCYGSAYRRINEGETTWEALVAKGMAMPDGRATMKRRTEFNQKFETSK